MGFTEKLGEITEILTNDYGEPGNMPRPQGRIRRTPEVRDSAGDLVSASEQYTISKAQHAAEWIRYCINHRPTTFGVMERAMYLSPTILFGGSIAVAAADKALGLGIADELASIQQNEDSHILIQYGQGLAHEVGELAGGESQAG